MKKVYLVKFYSPHADGFVSIAACKTINATETVIESAVDYFNSKLKKLPISPKQRKTNKSGSWIEWAEYGEQVSKELNDATDAPFELDTVYFLRGMTEVDKEMFVVEEVVFIK